MFKKILNIIDKIVKPVSANFIHFVWIFFLLLAPSVVYWLKMPLDLVHIKYLIIAIPICFWSSYLCCVIIYLIGSGYVRRIIYILLTLGASVECFLLLFFGTAISEMTMQFMLGTNLNETVGFFKTYIFTKRFLLYSIGVFLVLLLNAVSVRRFKNYMAGKYIRLLILLILIPCCILNIWRDVRFVKLMCETEIQTILHGREKRLSKNYTITGRLIYSSRMTYILWNDIISLEEVLNQNKLVTSSYKSPKIVVVIGESFNKNHSNLYGYHLNTNPLLTNELHRGNLYVFNDVITPFNATYRCLKSLLSFSSQDNNIYWASDLLFPAIFKRAGYFVDFISNQEVYGENNDMWSSPNDYLTNPKISPYLFDYMNPKKYQYDGELISCFKEVVNSGERSNLYLDIYHLQGQHAAYQQCYPKSYDIFTPNDYPHRTKLGLAEKTILASYDNATLYNDKVINDIIDLYRNEEVILLYFSDHGEEVYDFRNRAGRCHEEIISAPRARCEYSIPFMIWMSDKYKVLHPSIVKSISESLDYPFMIDDLPHLLIDLAGIEYESFEPSRSLINPSYNKDRKRYLEINKQCYEDIMK